MVPDSHCVYLTRFHPFPHVKQRSHLPRVGILAGVFDEFVKPFPRKAPWLAYHRVVGDSAFAGSVTLARITAVNWTSHDACGAGHAVLRTNPTSLDLTPPILVRHT